VLATRHDAATRITCLLLGAILLTAMAMSTSMSTARAAAPDQTLLLDVVINGRPIEKIGEFVSHANQLYAMARELREIGLEVPADAGSGLIPLSRLPEVSYQVDMPNQRLMVNAAAASLSPTMIEVLSDHPGRGIPVQSANGVTLNYNLVGTTVAGQALASGQFDARLFTTYGVASSGLLANLGDNLHQAIRLDSTYTYSSVDTMRRYRVGDVVSGGFNWTRPVRLGGAQITTDFSLRPDLVTFPVPGLSSQVAVPSTVDVLVNGVQQLSRNVPPGPFQVQQLPIVTGAGTVSMVVTNPLGQQTTETLPYYASALLLAPGISDYSAEAGTVRLNYGILSNDYDSMAASASFRRGVSAWLTLEAHAETTAGMVMGGGAAAIKLANLGVLSLSGAASKSAHSGRQFGIGIERITPVFSFSASTLVASKNFQDIAAVDGDPVPRLLMRASMGLSLGSIGSFGVAYTGINRDASRAAPIFDSTSLSMQGAAQGFYRYTYPIPAQHVQLVTASYSRRLFGSVYGYATAYYDLAESHSAGALIGVSIPIGNRGSVSLSGAAASGQDYGTVQAMRSVVDVGDTGGQALSSSGTTARQLAELDYKAPWALLGVGADRSSGQTAVRATAQGALSLVNGGVFASNTIYDGFAVVDTEGVKDVHVLEENRPIGVTDASGQLLVPDLRSYDTNRIGIDPRDVPVDSDVGQTTRIVRPQDRSGVVLAFPIRASRGATLHLVDDEGVPVAVGGEATLEATGVTVPVGYDGEAFVRGLLARNRVIVRETSGVTCIADFDFQPQARILPSIGPLRCHVQDGR
jgi:outer membrane usher protein